MSAISLTNKVSTQNTNTRRIMLVDDSVAGSKNQEILVLDDTLILSVFVTSLTGTLDVSATTFDNAGNPIEIITFPQISGTTTELLRAKANTVFSDCKVTAVYSGAAMFEVSGRAIAVGDTSVTIEGAATFLTSQKNITGVASPLVPASLTSRSGIILRNNGSETIFIRETATDTAAKGFPVKAGEAWPFNIAAGTTLYSVSSGGTVDVRIVETGS